MGRSRNVSRRSPCISGTFLSSEQKTAWPSIFRLSAGQLPKPLCPGKLSVTLCLSPSHPCCPSPSQVSGSHRCERLEKEGAKEEREVINTSRERLGCLPVRAGSSWSSGEESPESGTTTGASSMLITVTILPATRRQCGISFGGQTHLGSNPSSSIWAMTSLLSAFVSPF